MTPRRAVARVLAFVFITSIPTQASAQLLSLGPLQSILGSINTSSCTLPLLGSSPKLDTAVRRWARLGGSGTVRVIVSAQGGLLGTVKTIVSLLGVPLLDELTWINAIVLEVNGLTLSTLACSTAVASISRDPLVRAVEAASKAGIVVVAQPAILASTRRAANRGTAASRHRATPRRPLPSAR